MRPLVLGTALALSLVAPALGQTSAPPTFVTQQPANEWSAIVFIGEKVTNAAGEPVGDVNDLLFDHSGRISTAVLGVGGFLGIGEKSVAVPYSALTVSAGASGERVLIVPLTREALQGAPEYKPTEKTTFMKAREKAGELGAKALEKASELKDQAAKKIEQMTREEPKPK